MSLESSSAPSGNNLPTVIVPAHNEGAVIGRLLSALLETRSSSDPLDIVVACNGCTDDTASIARSFGAPVRVVEIAKPSKQEALRVGNEMASGYPRVFVDADIEISRESVQALVDAVAAPGVLAAGPERRLDRDSASWIVTSYYDVWERLPSVRRGLFGRGVIALSEAGHERIRDLPPVMGDDLVISESFGAAERTVVKGAVATIRIPRTTADLYRRRVRAATGNTQADQAELRGESSRLSGREFLRLLRREPRLVVKAPVFIGITVASRFGARRAVRKGDFETWRRDDSSRT